MPLYWYWVLGGRRLYDGVQEDVPLEPPLPLLVGAGAGGAALGVALALVAALQHEVVTVAEAVGVQPCNSRYVFTKHCLDMYLRG